MSQAGPKVKEIFVAALDREPGAERTAYLDEACRNDAELRLRVDVLLRAHERAHDVLGPTSEPAIDELTGLPTANPRTTVEPAPPLAADSDWTAADATRDEVLAQNRWPIDASVAQVGGVAGIGLQRRDRVRYFGDYEIHQELGRGGMGVVYSARQMSLNRQVALKMIRAGVLADDVELRRFQNEAEAVAQLDHPGIVPVYEVGEHQGQRYFSMKLIPGGSLGGRLDAYKDEPRAAAALLAEVAEAVQHAHARGILHRDLKPANILLDELGKPHVTDFGLAKKLEEGIELTQSGAVMGTPAYISPEQSLGRRCAVTTASDVYGLGAVLYAVLTGRAPFQGDSVIDTLQAVRERPADPPSRLNRKVPRDLEVICLKCLEKEPARRYASAAALADDLTRWLEGKSIRARPVSTLTRGTMWCKRNPVLAALSGSLTLALIGGMAGVVWKWRDAEYQKQLLAVARSQTLIERNTAIDSRDEAKAINHFLTEELLGQASPDKNPRGLKITAEELLERASGLIGATRMRPRIEAAVRDTIGATFVSLGKYAEAEPHLLAALEVRGRVLGLDDPETLATTDHLATLRGYQGKLAEAERLYRKNLADRTRVLGDTHAETAESLNNLALLLYQLGKYSEAETLLRRARAILVEIKGEEDTDTLKAMTNLARVNQFLGHFDEARPLLERVLELTIRLAGNDSPQTFDVLNALAVVYQQQGDLERAGALFTRNIEGRERVQGKSHTDVYIAKNNLMVLRREQGRLDEAESLAREVFDGFRVQLGRDHVNTLFSENNLAVLLHARGRLREAEPFFRETLELRRRTLPGDHPDLADTLSHLGELLVDDHRSSEAEPFLEEAVSVYRKALPAGHLRRALAEIRSGMCLADLGRFEEAETRLLKGYAALPPGKDTPSIKRSKVRDRIISLYESWGHPEKAARWRESTKESGPGREVPAKDLSREGRE